MPILVAGRERPETFIEIRDLDGREGEIRDLDGETSDLDDGEEEISKFDES